MDGFSTWLFDYERLGGLAKERAGVFERNDPFQHIVVDDFANPDLLKLALKQFPTPTDIQWFSYKNPLEVKLAQNKIDLLPPVFKRILWEFNSGPFIDFLEKMTGISGLIPDPDYIGGGLHQIVRGGKLDIHADFNWHTRLKLDRRINVILYLNENWLEEYGGKLELWDVDMSYCKSVLPLFNRMVCFATTDFTYHGHPDPLTCPEGNSRKSIALYYYSNGRPEEEKTASHSTLYQRRPQDDPGLDELRKKRAKGRLEDSST
jgi:hypothetical protein